MHKPLPQSHDFGIRPVLFMLAVGNVVGLTIWQNGGIEVSSSGWGLGLQRF